MESRVSESFTLMAGLAFLHLLTARETSEPTPLMSRLMKGSFARIWFSRYVGYAWM